MVIESPSNTQAQTEVDPTHAALRASARPLEHIAGAAIGGHYRLAARSGILTGAGIVAGAPLFSVRWTQPAFLFVLTFLEAYLLPTAVFTAPGQELGLDGILSSGFTTADSAGTGISLTNSQRARRTNMSPSLINDIRIGSVTLLTAGVRTLDANPFVAGSGFANVQNVAAGTNYVNPSGGEPPFGFRYQPDMHRGEHPIVLGASEGLHIRNAVAFPAAGTATLIVNMGWAEVPLFGS